MSKRIVLQRKSLSVKRLITEKRTPFWFFCYRSHKLTKRKCFSQPKPLLSYFFKKTNNFRYEKKKKNLQNRKK
jgi:hypothetical protein